MLRLTFIMMLIIAGIAGNARAAENSDSVSPIAFMLPKLGGGRLSSRDLHGQVVLLDVWATWCAPCQESMPFYQSLAGAYGERGLRVVAVSVDSDSSVVSGFVARHHLSFDVLLDPEGSLASRLDLRAMPTMLLLGHDGTVLWKHVGFDKRDKPTIKEKIDEALEK